jgi:membrane protein required for colicin V production
MSDPPLIDMIALAVIALAIARGVWIGLIREGLSLVAIGLCTIVTRLFVDPLSLQLAQLTGGDISGKAALWIAGLLLIMATVLVCGVAARLMKRGAQFAGLGWADRVGGGALGFAEGAIVAVVIVLIALWLVDPDHVAMKGARSVELVEELQSAREAGELPAVASPGKWF